MRHPTLLLAAALTLAGCATGTPRMQEAEVERLMGRYAGEVPGASLLVIRDGETLVQKSYGLADLESGRRAGPETNYRLASVTKQFTAAAVLLLAEDGRLDIDDKLRRWLPSLPAIADRITLRQLLIHRSGLIDYEDVMAEDTTVPLRDADVLRLLEGQETTYFEPGSEYRYSNSGYSLLALVVERASGREFPVLPAPADLPAAGDGAHARLRRRRPRDRRSRLWIFLAGWKLDADRPEHDQRGAGRWRHLLLDRRPGEVGRCPV